MTWRPGPMRSQRRDDGRRDIVEEVNGEEVVVATTLHSDQDEPVMFHGRTVDPAYAEVVKVIVARWPTPSPATLHRIAQLLRPPTTPMPRRPS